MTPATHILHALRRAVRVVAAVALMGSAIAWAENPTIIQANTAYRASQSVIGDMLGEHTLLDRSSQPVPLSRYRGKPLLVSFVYTGCFEICPTSTRTLQQALESLPPDLDESRFNVVSIGFNQPADSPTAMRAFAAQHRVGASNWDFLSPPPDAVAPLASDFGFTWRATPAGFDHVVQYTLVSAEGRVFQQIYGSQATPQELIEPLRRMLGGAEPPAPDLMSELWRQVRIVCTVYDPASGTYRFKYALLVEIAGGATFLIAMLWLVGSEWRSRRALRRGLRGRRN